MSLELKDGSVTEDPRLDRLVEFDERSREFRVGSLVPAERPRERIWHLGHSRMGDQGQEGACVEFGIMHSALTLPKMAAITVGHQVWRHHLIYWPAQGQRKPWLPADWAGDPWPGGKYPGATPTYDGTSVLSGLKVGLILGLYKGFYWAFTLQEFLQGLGTVGSAVIGVPWTQGMGQPNRYGLIEATGPDAGGHCVCVLGMDYAKKFPDGRVVDVLVIAQSWGRTHGLNGIVYLPIDQFDGLRQRQGEAAFITGRTALRNLTVR